MKPREIILIAVIVLQAIWGSCERKSLEKEFLKHLNGQKREINLKLDSLHAGDQKHNENIRLLLDSVASKESQIIYITQTTNEK